MLEKNKNAINPNKPKVWKPEFSANKDDDKIYFRLQENDYGDILLLAVDYKGDRITGGDLLNFDFDLQIVIVLNCVTSKVPLKTNVRDALIFTTTEELESILERVAKEKFMINMLKEITSNKDEQKPTIN